MSLDATNLPYDAKTGRNNQLAQLQTRAAAQLRLGLSCRSTRYGLRRDLHVPIQQPTAKIPIAVRPMEGADLPVLLATDAAGPQDLLEIAWRRAFLAKGAKTCFVAVDLRDNKPCYMQWLIGSADNRFISKLGSFPQLQSDEALLENAYTPVAHRGLGIMSAAMAMIGERAADIGARHVLTFVDQHNVPSLKGCQRAGFFPHMLHHKHQLAFGLVKRQRFEILAESDPRRSLRF